MLPNWSDQNSCKPLYNASNLACDLRFAFLNSWSEMTHLCAIPISFFDFWFWTQKKVSKDIFTWLNDFKFALNSLYHFLTTTVSCTVIRPILCVSIHQKKLLLFIFHITGSWTFLSKMSTVKYHDCPLPWHGQMLVQ